MLPTSLVTSKHHKVRLPPPLLGMQMLQQQQQQAQQQMLLQQQQMQMQQMAGALISPGAGTDGKKTDKEQRKMSLYKTELCRSWEETGQCRYGLKCQFAHSRDELRIVDRHPKYKTQMCKTFWEKGSCPYGKRCCFIHTAANSSNVNVNDTTIFGDPDLAPANHLYSHNNSSSPLPTAANTSSSASPYPSPIRRIPESPRDLSNNPLLMDSASPSASSGFLLDAVPEEDIFSSSSSSSSHFFGSSLPTSGSSPTRMLETKPSLGRRASGFSGSTSNSPRVVPRSVEDEVNGAYRIPRPQQPSDS
ncbi:hypothetical protein HK101_005296, partial [Irineochytrium annulatum]